jgi:O-antigen ligase
MSARTERAKAALSWSQWIALGAFALMAVLGPLAFGAVDRLPQIGLLVLLMIGILAQPPAIVPLSKWGNRLAIAFVALLIFKEFAPAAWFGDTFWRTTLTRKFALPLPFTHNPEPSRALDALVTGAVGLLWFLWVRRLAAERNQRTALAWILVVAAAVVAIVSFWTRHPGAEAIYGLRFTRGWGGFGPFPNRNHTASYFAMAGVLGCGCLVWAAMRKRWLLFVLGLPMMALIVIALLTTESRGGLIAFAAGLAVYVLLCLCKTRNWRAAGISLGGVLCFAAVILTFGGKTFARFQSSGTREISNHLRVDIWHDSLAMWKDAPLLGHGAGVFAGVFPLYQKADTEGMVVVHPESSWLLWLTELGLIPVLIGVTALVVFLFRHMGGLFERHRSFFLHVAGLAAFLALLVHGIFDIPAHGWVTGGFALAALAVAFPVRLGDRRAPEPRQAALVPLAVAALWWIPIRWGVPAWSALHLNELTERVELAPGFASIGEMETALRYFPLDADLHWAVGFRQLRANARANMESWQRHFGVARLLQPSVWSYRQAAARACQRVAPSVALEYWREAVDVGGVHSGDLFSTAVAETARFPAAQSFWDHYVETHPQMLLIYAKSVPEVMGQYYFRRWWKLRAAAADLTPGELRDFYEVAPRWGNLEDFEDWARQHGAIGVRDYREWAALYHHWAKDERAWQILSVKTPEPAFPSAKPTVPRDLLEASWRITPDNVVNAQQLALVLQLAGDQPGSDAIVTAVARKQNAPPWFVQKGAWILERSGHPGDAVELLLQH